MCYFFHPNIKSPALRFLKIATRLDPRLKTYSWTAWSGDGWAEVAYELEALPKDQPAMDVDDEPPPPNGVFVLENNEIQHVTIFNP